MSVWQFLDFAITSASPLYQIIVKTTTAKRRSFAFLELYLVAKNTLFEFWQLHVKDPYILALPMGSRQLPNMGSLVYNQ